MVHVIMDGHECQLSSHAEPANQQVADVHVIMHGHECRLSSHAEPANQQVADVREPD